MPEFLYTKEQQAIMDQIDGQLYVVAHAGTGKSTTLVARTIHMQELGIPKEKILFITFSNKCVQTIKKKYQEFDEAFRLPNVMTLHAFCLGLLNKVYGKSCTLIREPDVKSYLNGKVAHEARRRKWTGTQPKQEDITTFINEMNRMRSNDCPLVEFRPQKISMDLFRALYDCYTVYKKDIGAYDFQDLIQETIRLIGEQEALCDYVRSTYPYIVVDEYQDLNPLQHRLVTLLAGPDGNLAVAGDDDQTIYRFQGSKSSLLKEFKTTYPNAKRYELSRNFRSSTSIVDAVKRFLNGPGGLKRFLPGRRDSGRCEAILCLDRMDQQEKVCLTIQRLLAEGCATSDIAILYRLHQQRDAMMACFLERGIPFKVGTGGENLSSMSPYFKLAGLLLDYHEASGENAFRKRNALAAVLRRPETYLSRRSMEQAASWDDWANRISPRNAPEIQALRKRLSAYRTMTPAQMLTALASDGLTADLASRTNGSCVNLEYRTYMDVYRTAERCGNWQEFKREIQEKKTRLDQMARNDGEGVTFSTIHGAKGEEWRHVLVIDCIDGMYPLRKAESPEEKKEERMLFHVCATRPKEQFLAFCYSMDFDTPFIKKKEYVPSPYLYEMGLLRKPGLFGR